MTKALKISDDLSLPIDAVTGTFCVVGIRGSGKSTTAAVMAEEMLKAKQQIVVLDPKDDWWGLRSSADGKSEGLPVTILGGSHQDAPLESTAGALVAELILNERISAIISTKHLSDGQRFRFTYDFCDFTYKHCREPMHIFMDEADQFAPQERQFKVQRGDSVSESMMLSLVRRVIKQGRTSGLGISLITQSPATLDKRVMNMCETLVAMRVVGAQDFDAVEKWFKVYLRKKEDLETIVSQLPTLKAGQGVFYSPAWLEVSRVVQFRMTETFDSRKTPKVGERRVEPKVLAPVDLKQLSERMAATIEKAKAEDPKELRRQIADLKKQVAVKTPAAAKPVETIKTVKTPIFKDSQIKRVETLAGAIGKRLDAVSSTVSTLREFQLSLDGLLADMRKVNANGHIPAPTPRASPPPAQRPPAPRPAPSSGAPPDSSLNKGELAILRAAVQFGSVTGEQLAVLTGYKATSRYEYLRSLIAKGMVRRDGDNFEPTDEGQIAAGEVELPPVGAELIDWWKRRLSGGELKIFEVVTDANGAEVTKETIEERTGYKSTSIYEYTRKLAARKLVSAVRGNVKPADFLFQ